MRASIPAVHIEANGDEILIEQDLGGDTHYVSLHLIHVRYMAERLGLVASTDLNAEQRVETLSRRLRVLHARLESLTHYLINHSDHEHADLSWEMTYCRATCDIADEFVADLGAVGAEPATPVTDACDVTRDVTAVTQALPTTGQQLQLPA